jgi:uncharacterized protein YggE
MVRIPLILLTAGLCLAQEAKIETPYIAVSGTSEVKVAPDQVELSVGLQARSRDLSAAVEQQRTQSKQIIALALQHGVLEKDVQTSYARIVPQFHEKTGIATYWVYRSVTITLQYPSRYEALLSALIASGVNEVHGLEFRTTGLRKYRDQARAQALTAAREKADAMAGRLGRKIGKVLSIEETEAPSPWASNPAWLMQNSSSAAPGGGGSSGGLALGQISVDARVKVSFELQ